MRLLRTRPGGLDTVTLADARTASQHQLPRETGDSFMKSYVANLEAAGSAAAGRVHRRQRHPCALVFGLMMPFLAFMLLTGMPTEDAANEAWFYALSPVMKLLFLGTVFTVLPAFLVVIFGYYFVIEGRFGRTPGKALLGLRVLKTDGTKIGYKEAILRNLSKYNNVLIVIDVLIMLFFFNREKQRGCDRIADTIVVHTKA
jgi:uncharacterized RDD family membrane protein YckC